MCGGCVQSGLSAAEAIGLEPQTTKLITIATAAVMLFSLAAPMAAPTTTVKSGAVCAKANQKIVKAGKTFVCKKSGKKLVWRVEKKKSNSQAVAPNTYTPTTPTEPAKPQLSNFFINNKWATEVNRTQLIDSAIFEVKKFVDANTSTNTNFELYFDDKILESDKQWMTKQIGFIASSFGKFHPAKYHAFVSLTDQWIMDKATSMGMRPRDPNFPCGRITTWENYCADLNVGYFILKGRYEQNPGVTKIPWQDQVIGVFPHEYFHSVQKHLHKGTVGRDVSEFKDAIPQWLNEGSASFFGMAMSSLEGTTNYDATRWLEVDNHQDYKGAAGKNPLRAFWNNWHGEPGGYKNPYGIGRVATEYIVANIGVEGFLEIYKNTSSLSDFAAGFEKAAGISLNDFYNKFDGMRSKVGLQAVSP
jgi:hypothetical protein